MPDDYFGEKNEKWDWKNFKNTQGFPISDQLIEWIIGQDQAIRECRLCIDEWVHKLTYLKKKKWWKAFEDPMGLKPQPKEWLPAGPFLLLLGDAGTGKSLIGRAMSSYMTEVYKKHKIKLYDVLSWKNKDLPSEPKISIHQAGKGKEIIFSQTHKIERKSWFQRWGIKLLRLFMGGFGLVLIGLSMFIILASENPLWTLITVSPLVIGGGSLLFFAVMIGWFGKLSGGGPAQGIGGAERSDAPKLLVDNSSGRVPYIDACLLPETMVWTNQTLRNNYQITDSILNREGYSQKIINIEKRQWKGKIVRIKPRLLPEIVVTENHPILTQNRGWIIAKELQPNDVLIIQIPKSVNREIPEDLAWLFGIYLAEGFVKKEGYNWNQKKHGEHWARELGFTLGFHEEELSTRIKTIFKKYYNYKLKEDYHNSQEIQLNCYSANLNRFFRNSFGESATSKHIPADVFMWNEKGKRAFLRGYWEGDRINSKQNGYATASKQLFYDLIALHLSLGEIPSTFIHVCKGGIIRGRKVIPSLQYSMVINGKEKARNYKQKGSQLLLPVRNVRIENYSGEIINLETEDGTVPLPFITHNTGHGSAQLFGSIAWDPYQTGGLGTPEHQRVSAGDVHRAHLGILFIDEIKNLTGAEAITLLTVLEEGQIPIALRSLFHGGDTAAMAVSTEPVPAMVFFIAAGNLDSLPNIHPALLDRIQGYGKTVYMNNYMDNTVENRRKVVQFIAQEIKRFNLLPFTRESCIEIIEESRRKSGRKDKLTTKFRPLISIIKTASTLARDKDESEVDVKYVREAVEVHCKSIYQQILERIVTEKNVYLIINPKSEPKIGQIYGLAVTKDPNADEMMGTVLPIRASMEEPKKKQNGYFHITGVDVKNESYIQHSISKVSHVIQQICGFSPLDKRTHIDFAQSHGVEGPSAGVAMTLALLSIINKKEIRQDVAVTGEINVGVDGQIMITPIGGTHEKIMAAQRWGFSKVLIPLKNYENDIIPSEYKIKVVGCQTIEDYAREIFD